MELFEKPSEKDHVRGELSAPVVLVHYGDFQCPFSGAAHPVIERLRERMGGNLCVVFRQFPLGDIHPDAVPAALAAEAAGRQGKFWDMHDRLFASQDFLDEDDLREHARAVGLDTEQFARDLSDPALEQAVRSSVEGGKRSGVHGTPTFWINDRFHDNREGLWKPERLLQAVEEALP